MNIRRLYKRIRYWRQIRQGFPLLEDIGTKVELTHITGLTKVHKKDKK